MKKKYTKFKFSATIITLLAIVTLVSVLLYACKKPTDGIKIIIDSSTLFPAPTLLKFTNADSTSTNRPDRFPVTISGPGAKYVQLISGGTNFQVTNGFLSLSLTKDANPSANNPIIFTVSANITGFAPITQNIAITKNALSVYPIKAVEYAHPPIGTTALAGVSTTLNAGALPSGYILTTPTTGTMAEQATLTFAAGTQMLDANNTVINGTALNSYIIQYGIGTDASIQAFPGGFYAPVAFKNDFTQIAGGVNFVTAGLLQINLDASGTPIKKFSKPVSVSIELNAHQVNFATGNTLQVGDVIPVWSMNEANGQWTNEAAATVILDGNGRKAAQFTITHLSCWNLDWTWGPFGAYPACDNQLPVTLTTSDPNFIGGPYDITVQTPTGDYLCGIHGVTIYNGYTVTLPSLPSIPQAKLVVSGGIPYSRVQSNLFTPCGNNGISLSVPIGPSNPINVNIDIHGFCTTKDITIYPTAAFELYQQTGGSQTLGTATYADAGSFELINGKGTTGLQVGRQYYFTTVYNGVEYKTGTFSVSKADTPIPSTGTSGLVASGVYDAATNTLNITGTIPITCN